ncbi:MAG: GNAT family N-acetyltransferase [Cyanobacteria bacterium J06633_8]
MTFTIQQTNSPSQLSLCHQLLVTVFHHELNLFGMEIPDRYDPFSVYMQIRSDEAIVGTYRLALPNDSVGLPIEEVGFDISQFAPDKICEMSRLVLLKDKRGKIPFSKIIFSACSVAAEHNASILVAAILPRNVPLFKRQGFLQMGQPINDPSVESTDGEDAVIVPMYKRI